MRVLMLFLSIFLIQSSFAKVTEYQVDNFAKINDIYQHSSINPKTTLLAFDLDDTLITMSQPLGSVGWWDWQSGLLKNDKNAKDLFTTDYNQLVRIQNILFQLIKMDVTDENVLPFIQQAANDEATIIGLTARGKEHLSATLMQLTDNQFMENDQLLFKRHGLKIPTGSFACPKFTRDVIYQDGIIFLSGEDKGQALTCILSSATQQIQTIIFVDDSAKNTQAVKRSFADRNDVNVIDILFTKENSKEAEIQANNTLQDRIYSDWNHIKQSLHDVIPQSNF